MGDFSQFGKTLIILGLILAVAGGLFLAGGKIPWIGRLPGDFVFRGKNFTFYFPLATSILVSVVLTLVFYLFRHK